MIGQLYFQWKNQDYTGSACVIGRNLLLTCTHNLYEFGAWSLKLAFIPAARNEQGTFGMWTYETSAVNEPWFRNQKLTGHDVGLIQLRQGGLQSRPIGEIVGMLPYVYGGDPRGCSWRDVGYPSDDGNTRWMYAQDGTFTRMRVQDTVVAMTGNFGKGTSGGPWLYSYDGVTCIYGLHITHEGNEALSPYFGDWVNEFIQEQGLGKQTPLHSGNV
jgi:V8-like Glu-specific endopeptidase